MARESSSPKAGVGALVYAALCYLVGVGGLVYCVLFLLGWAPTAIDAAPRHSLPVALAIDIGLIVFWGVQHSVMARAGFKRWWTRIIPAHTERATYCMASGLALAIVCLAWSPLPGVVFTVGGAASFALTLIGLGGVVLLLAASFEIDHFELFGLRQPWRAFRGQPTPSPRFQERYLYSLVRHPIQLGVLMLVWITPDMTVSRALFAAAMTVYIHVGLYFEERALVRELGEPYLDYMERTPKLIPFTKGWGTRAPSEA